ncbi:CRISPR-associated endonuclease Cas2 [Granulimonas faecalis]|uniref:CRISPR-associated endonuclease Cas2 n=1 Tax=Granulimonas faecalis TaxID=2894155 RepID=UPI0035148C1E
MEVAVYVLVTYDVSTKSPGGEGRLRKVARTCERYGQRVQNSVFECIVEPADYHEFLERLKALVDDTEDTVRLYNLGKRRSQAVEIVGRREEARLDDTLIV